MIQTVTALAAGLFIAMCVLGFGALSGVQSDVGYGPGEDIGVDTSYVDSGYDMVDTTDSGDDIGNDFRSGCL